MQQEIRKVRQELSAAKKERDDSKRAAGVVEAQTGTHLEEVKRLQSQCVTAAADRDAAMSEAGAYTRPLFSST